MVGDEELVLREEGPLGRVGPRALELRLLERERWLGRPQAEHVVAARGLRATILVLAIHQPVAIVVPFVFALELAQLGAIGAREPGLAVAVPLEPLVEARLLGLVRHARGRGHQIGGRPALRVETSARAGRLEANRLAEAPLRQRGIESLDWSARLRVELVIQGQVGARTTDAPMRAVARALVCSFVCLVCSYVSHSAIRVFGLDCIELDARPSHSFVCLWSRMAFILHLI